MSELNKPHFQNADKAREYLEDLRWHGKPICPHCGVIDGHYTLTGPSTRPGLWKCRDCREQFTVTVGTVFERSKIALNIWLQAVYMVCTSKKGVSSHQLHRMLGVTYKTAWFMSHRIREAMKSGGGLLGGGGGTVEADETFWGTKKGADKKAGYGHKMKVLALVERGGKARGIVIPNVSGKTLALHLKANVAPDTHLHTDELNQYKKPGRKYFASHSVVNHRAGEYSRGDVTTNNVEGYFSLLKRGLIGTFHHVSEEHLQRYVSEFDFRFNNRKVTDAERTTEALKGIAGKRLTYRRTDRTTQA